MGLLLITFCILVSVFDSGYSKSTKSHDWDYIVFPQQWPNTICTEYKSLSIGNKCRFPHNALQWTVHGVWPSKTGEHGPFNCPTSIRYNQRALQTLQDDLDNHWTNIYGGGPKDSFWLHEWTKHGTCAVLDIKMNSLQKYFQTGIDLNGRFDLTRILSESRIVPGPAYSIDEIFRALRNKIGKQTYVQCYTDRRTRKNLLKEIRICLNKQLGTIDCPSSNGVHTNCYKTYPVHYISNVKSELTIGNAHPSRRIIQLKPMHLMIKIKYFKPMQYVSIIRKRIGQLSDVGTKINYSEMYTIIRKLIWLTL